MTETPLNLAPATITHISKIEISRSAARSLDELLRIYVPGLQVMGKSNGDALGIRGVISDRNDKFLILVNGKAMNERTVLGGVSERFLSMLSDIEYINVIRGPGSVISGPGAIAGTIEIITKSGKSPEGTTISARQGIVEKFSSTEISTAHQFKEGSSVYAYIGLDKYDGASVENAPYYFSHNFTSSKGEVITDEPVTYPSPNENQSYRKRIRLKAHLQYNTENLELWARYTNGGKNMISNPSTWRENQPLSAIDNRGVGYQQLSLHGNYNFKFNDVFNVKADLGFDMMDFERENGRSTPSFRSYREDEYFGRILANWTPRNDHSLAFGLEYRHEIFGKPSPGYPYVDAFITPSLGDIDPWSTNTMSLLGEYKWNIFDDLTLYSGLRFDDSERLDSNLSSRVALVKSFGDSDVLKITFNNSVRNPVESAIQESKQNNAAPGEVETIKFLEGRWEHVINENINFAFGGYYADHDISAFSSSNFTAEVLGNTKYYGIEIEFSYNTENTKFSIAHNVTDLINFDLTDLTLERQQISSNPYGYGSNFANWSKHQTTINAVYTITDKIETNASLTILWGFPGLEDYASYNMIELGGILNLPLTDGSTRAFEESVFLNFGARYQVNDDMFVRLNAHNVLGLADKKLNKTNVFIRSGMYQSQAASLSISLDFNF